MDKKFTNTVLAYHKDIFLISLKAERNIASQLIIWVNENKSYEAI